MKDKQQGCRDQAAALLFLLPKLRITGQVAPFVQMGTSVKVAGSSDGGVGRKLVDDEQLDLVAVWLDRLEENGNAVAF